jgi:hypothetical protein
MSTGRVSLFWSVKKFQIGECFKVLACYLDPWFFTVDLLYWIWGFFSNPYRSCRKFFKGLDKPHLGIYGETPFSVWTLLCKELKLSSKDVFYELGSGRGKGCFWINRITGAKVVGIERHPIFAYGSLLCKKILLSKETNFLKGDFFSADYSKATVIYLYATCLKDAELSLLAKKMAVLKGTTIVTVSKSLAKLYPDQFILQKNVQARFPWGMASIYFQTPRKYQ